MNRRRVAALGAVAAAVVWAFRTGKGPWRRPEVARPGSPGRPSEEQVVHEGLHVVRQEGEK